LDDWAKLISEAERGNGGARRLIQIHIEDFGEIIETSAPRQKSSPTVNVCAASGMCVRTAPELFDQDESDDRVLVAKKRLDRDSVESARKAVFLCPSGALSLDEVEDALV
jgi:ferredoxin